MRPIALITALALLATTSVVQAGPITTEGKPQVHQALQWLVAASKRNAKAEAEVEAKAPDYSTADVSKSAKPSDKPIKKAE